MNFYNNFSFISIQSTKNVSTKVLQKTKELTLSRQKYNSFLDSTISTQEKKNYKLPKIKMKHSDSQKTIEEKTGRVFENIILPYKNKNPFTNKNLKIKKKQEQFFLSELIENNKNKDKTEDKKVEFNKQNIHSIKRILKFPRTMKNNIPKKFNILSNLKKEQKEKQIFLLIDSIFFDKKINKEEEKLKYEEEKIFGYRNKYLEFLKKELTLLHKGEKELEKNANIFYEYNNRIYGKIKLELKSANILVTDKETQEDCCSIDIPFSMLCLFYLSHIKELTYIVLDIFRDEVFLENNQDKLMDELKDFLKNQIYFENDSLKYNYNIDEEDRKSIFDDYLSRRNVINRANIKYNFLSLYSKKEAFKQINFENRTFAKTIISNINDINTHSNFAYNSNSSETLKILFDTNINVINFSWISLNHNYNIKITMPQIVIYIDKFKKEVNHFINRELMAYLLMNNFKNFNFFIVHYLFTLQNFRSGIYKALSYYHLCKLYPFFDKILNNENYNNNLIHEKYHISNIRFEEYENSLNNNEYTFYVSDDNQLHLYKMKSYILFIYSLEDLEDTSNTKIFFFDFSFYHMKVLYYKSKYDNLLQFLQRLLKYNPTTKEIFLDYSFFTSFKYMNTEQIDRYFRESSFKITDNIKNSEEEVTQNDLVLRVLEPKFISVSVDKKGIDQIDDNKIEGVKKMGNVGNELIEKLIGSDIKDWGKILWENKDDIEILKDKKGRQSVFRGKRDFKTIFKKFLKIN